MSWSISPTSILTVNIPYILESCDNPSTALNDDEKSQIISWIIEELEYNTDLDQDIFTNRPDIRVDPDTDQISIEVGIVPSVDPKSVADEIISVLQTSIPVGEDRLLSAAALEEEREDYKKLNSVSLLTQ